MSEDCPHCVFEKTEANCRGCFEGSHYRPKPVTNAEKWRAMEERDRCPKCGGEMWWFGGNYACRDCHHIVIRSYPIELDIPQTNGDRIRSMSDEELAEWMGKNADCAFCQIEQHCQEEEHCGGNWLKWLKSPAEKDGDA